MQQSAKDFLFRLLRGLMGRRRLGRLAFFLDYRVRYDFDNDHEHNGEGRLQETVLQAGPREREPVILDVGANKGIWTLALLERARKAGRNVRIRAFEPCEATRGILEANVANTPGSESVQIERVALSDSAGTAHFYSYGAGAGVNSLHANSTREAESVETVEMQTLDSYCEQEGIASVDFVKIDTEGNDMAVLKGARGMLEKGAIGSLQFEYNYLWVNSRHYLRDAFELLEPLGYQIGKVTPDGIEFYNGWDPTLETFWEANFVAVRRDVARTFPTVAWWREQAGNRQEQVSAQ